MSNKTVIVILIVAASLLAFIFLFEQDTMTTSERMARKGRVFPELKKEAITALEIKSVSDQKIVVEKVSDPAAVEEEWRIKSPGDFEADDTEVKEVLSALDFLLVDRAVEGADKQTDPAFALKSPRIEGAFVQRGQRVTFRVGADAEGEKVYFATSEAPDRIFAVNNDIVDSLDKDLDDLRSKALVQRQLTNVTSVSLSRALGEVSMKQVDDRWQVHVDEAWILGAADQARSIIHLVEDLQAERFIADNAKSADLGKWGLAKPEMTLKVETEKNGSVSVLVGRACEGDKAQRYVTVAGSNIVACVNDDFSVIGDRPLARFQESRPGVFEIEDVEKIVISDKNRKLSMVRKEGKWQQSEDNVAFDAAVIEEMLKGLTETRASNIALGEEAIAAMGEARVSVTLTLADEMGEVAFSVSTKDDSALLRRGEEVAVLTVPTSLADGLAPDVLRFRDRRLFDEEPVLVQKLVITGPISQTVEKVKGIWQVTHPVAVSADSGAVRKLAELMATLTVDRFEAESEKPEHGFNSPFAVIEAGIKKVHDHEHTGDDDSHAEEKDAHHQQIVLEIGRETAEGKRYGRVRGQPVVFLIGDDFEYAIRNPLVARDVLQIDDTQVQRVAVSAQTGERVFSKENGRWRAEDGETFDPDALKRILADLGGLKAVSAHAFGPAGKPFETPLLSLTFSSKGDEAKQEIITVAEQRPGKDTVGYLVRKEGLAATMVVSSRVVDEILAFMSKKETSPQKSSTETPSKE